MSEHALAHTIEHLSELAVACTGFDERAYANEFSRRVDQAFPIQHPQREMAIALASGAGYLDASRELAEA